MIKNIALVGAFSALAFTSCAFATDNQADQKKFYFQLNTGASYGSVSKGDFGEKKQYSWSSVVGAELGYQINDKLRAGLDITYRPNYTPKNIYSTTQDMGEIEVNGNTFDTYGISNFNAKYKVRSLTVMANAYYDILTTNNFTPYLTLGAGLARNTVKETETINATGGIKYTSFKRDMPAQHASITTSKNNFAYKLGAGVKYSINQSFDVDLRYQYVDLGKIKVNETKISRQEKGKLSSSEFIVGVTYKF